MRQLSPATRDAILSGTVELLSRRDFSEVTTREIACASHIAEKTLFRYFATKEDILRRIVEDLGERFFAEVASRTQGKTGRARLDALCAVHASFASRNRDLLTLLQRELSVDRAASRRMAVNTLRFLAELRTALGECAPAKGAQLDEFVFLLHGVVPALLLRERLEGPETPAADFEAAAGRLHRLLLSALEGERCARSSRR